jgi:Fe-S-cluster-containing dehydrogenase component
VIVVSGVPAESGALREGHKRAVPPSDGYLLVDPLKCQGCLSCMAACSLVNHGRVNLSLARIQVTHDHLAGFPSDAVMAQCRQCVDPLCLPACPEGALHLDSEHGNVRRIDEERCIGCRECIEACPYPLARSVWNHETELAEKCDLCADAPFWPERGSPPGKKACVEICPVHAIAFTTEVPQQEGDSGYLVNLRGKTWEQFGYTTE